MSGKSFLGILVYGWFALVGSAHPMQAIAQTPAEVLRGGEKFSLRSEILSEERGIVVRLPQGYETSTMRYPVLYVLDGEYFFRSAVAAVDFLSENAYVHFAAIQQPVPQMIVVGIINVDRNRDFTPTHAPVQGSSRFPTSGGADRFLEFLRTELIPLVDRQYRTQQYRVLSGWSLGGLLTVYTFLTQSNLFSAYLAISPSLWWDDQLIVRQADSLLSAGAVTSRPLVVTLGSLEGSGMSGSVRDGFVAMFDRQSNGESSVTYIEVPGEEHRYVPYKALFDGLRALYSGWMMPDEIMDGGWDAVVAFFDDLSARWGYAVEIPESAYYRLASTVNDAASALEVAVLATRRFPRSSWAQYRLGRLQYRLGDREAARSSYLKALELERSYAEPDSERLLWIHLQLEQIEQEMGVGRHEGRSDTMK